MKFGNYIKLTALFLGMFACRELSAQVIVGSPASGVAKPAIEVNLDVLSDRDGRASYPLPAVKLQKPTKKITAADDVLNVKFDMPETSAAPQSIVEQPVKVVEPIAPTEQPKKVVQKPMEVAKQVPQIAQPEVFNPQNGVVVKFASESKELAKNYFAVLDKVVAFANENSSARIQLYAYATESSDNRPGSSKRLSLERALAIRSYLINNNVSSKMIDVFALGSATEVGVGEKDFVEIKFF